MIIEFIGAPGSGKTTLLPTVIETLRERGIRANSVVGASRPYAQRTLLGRVVCRLAPASLHRPLLWQVFYRLSFLCSLNFSAKHARLVWQVLASQRHRPSGARAGQRRVLYWFFHMAGYYEFLAAHARPGEALVFDEGFIHRVVQLNASDVEVPRPSQVLAYVDLLPKPDLLVFTQAPPEVCTERIRRRGIWEHFGDKSLAEVGRYVENAHEVVRLAAEHAEAKGWTVIQVDNGSEDLNGLRSQLRGKLMALEFDRGPQAVNP